MTTIPSCHTATWLRILLITTIAHCAIPAQGQEASRRQRFVEGLLEAFIDSQLPETKPAGETPQVPRASVRRSPSSTNINTDELREASRILAAASDEMSALIGALQDDLYRAPGVRQLMSLAMKVKADATVLARQLAQSRDLDQLREALRSLDQNWHTLEYRLSQLGNLSRRSQAHLERIRQYEQTLAEMLDVGKQVDQQQLNQQALALHAGIRRLLEDIRFELTDTDRATELVTAGRNVFEMSRDFSYLVTQPTPYSRLRNEYEALEAEWLRYERQVRGINNRYVQRQLQRVGESIRSLHGLMYLDTRPTQREDLQYALRILRRDTDQLLQRVNLKLLAELPAARTLAVAAASDFDVACRDFADVLAAGDDLEVLRELYVYVHDEWERLRLSLQGISSSPARQAMRDVDGALSELQTLLAVHFDFDRASSTDRAATIMSLASHAQKDIRDIFARPNRYQRQFQTDALRAAAQFNAAARKLHQSLSNGEKLRQVRNDCDAMASAWATLDRHIPRFNLGDGQHLTRLRRETTPHVVHMQTLLTL